MKQRKFKNTQKPNDKFWRDNMMKILDCLFWEEATWAIQRWGDYGVSVADRKRIEQEFERFQQRPPVNDKPIQRKIFKPKTLANIK